MVLCKTMAIAPRSLIKIRKIKSLSGLSMLKILNCLAFCLQNEFIRKRRT